MTTGVLEMLDFDDAVRPEQRRKFRWTWVVATMVAVAVLSGVGFLAAPFVRDGKLVTGVAIANSAEVTEYADERKAQEIADQKARDAALLTDLEKQLKQNMQKYFDDPANDKGLPITVIDVAAVKVGENKYEAMATMRAGNYTPRQVPIHVTADDRNIMWSSDSGALLPLFR
jgi:hypothetical protein